METYYHPHDLSKFGDMGKEAPELWKKFLEWYNSKAPSLHIGYISHGWNA